MKKYKDVYQNPVIQGFHSFRPKYVVSYSLNLNRSYNSYGHLLKGFNQPKQSISKQSFSKLYSAMQWLVFISPVNHVYEKSTEKWFRFKLAFITLTLSRPQFHSDNHIKEELLQPFLQWLIRVKNCTHYVWKAETQSNGNIHFHITINIFVHWKEIRTKWNQLQMKHGYLGDGVNNSDKLITNSTDIHSVKNNKHISFYIAKYFTKNKDYANHNQLYCNIDDKVKDLSNYNMIQYKDGLIYSFRRLVHGRSWGISSNLPTKGITIEEGTEAYRQLSEFIKLKRNGQPEYLDTCTLHKLKEYGLKEIPDTVKNNLLEVLNLPPELKLKSKKYEVYSFK